VNVSAVRVLLRAMQRKGASLMRKVLTIGIIVLAVVVIVCGAVSIGLGVTNSKSVSDHLKDQKVSLQIFDENASAGTFITHRRHAWRPTPSRSI
jgi:hypothetical protein